jgi:hypothetical protein
MPPLGRFVPETGFVPDYPVLLMFDEFVVDGGAVERITTEAGDPWLGPWPEIIEIISSEGSLRVIDLEPELASVGHERSVLTQRDLRDPGRWVEAMEYHDSIVAGADMAFASNLPAAASPYDWSFNPRRHAGIRGADGLRHLPAATLAARPEDLDAIHQHVRERAIAELKSQLREVNAISATAAKFDAACMYWAPYSKYLETKAGVQDRNAPEAARLFFELAFPLFRPTTVRQFAKLRSDRRLRHLREEIERAYKTGDVLDRGYPQRILVEVLRSQQEAAQVRKILGWVATPASFVLPALGMMPTATAEGIGVVSDRLRKRTLDWFYLISDGVGIT